MIITSTDINTKLRSLIRCWPVLPILFIGWTLWATSPKVNEFTQGEILGGYSSRILNEERQCLDRLSKLKDLPEDDPRLLAERESLAAIYLGQRRFPAAENIYKDVLKTRSLGKQDLTSTRLAMAELYCDMGNFEAAEHYYKQIWQDDKKQLTKNDPRITRDLNNLGVIYYLLAMGTPDKLERELELNRSNFFLIQAEILNRSQSGSVDHQDEANVWDNRCLVLRELGAGEEAAKLKNRAKFIHRQECGRIDPP